MLLQSARGSSPAGAGPWRAPAVRWQHEPAVQPGPAAEPRLRPLGGWGWASRDTAAGLIIPAGSCLHLLGGLIGIQSTFGLQDAFGLELAHPTPKPWGFFLRFAHCICGEPCRVPGDQGWCLVLYPSFSARVAEILLLLPTKPVSVPAS